jgi:hypothetical protein
MGILPMRSSGAACVGTPLKRHSHGRDAHATMQHATCLVFKGLYLNFVIRHLPPARFTADSVNCVIVLKSWLASNSRVTIQLPPQAMTGANDR